VDELPPGQAARRQRIVAAAALLLERQPYEQVQVKDVAAEAHVALGTLYRYFRSKEQLCAAVLTSWGGWAPAPGATAEARLRARIDLLIASVEQRPHFFTMEHVLQSCPDPEVKQVQQAWSRAGATWLAADLPAQPAEMLWAIIDHVLRRATLHGGSFDDARATAHAFVDLLVEPLGLD